LFIWQNDKKTYPNNIKLHGSKGTKIVKDGINTFMLTVGKSTFGNSLHLSLASINVLFYQNCGFEHWFSCVLSRNSLKLWSLTEFQK